MTIYVNCKNSEGSGNYRKFLKSQQKNILLIFMGFTENNKGARKRFIFLIYPLKQRRITHKEHWYEEDCQQRYETIPPITPIPTAFCAPLPAPLLIAWVIRRK